MKITKIEEIQRDKKRLNVYVEDKYCTKLTAEIIVRNNLYEGLIMDRLAFEELIFLSEDAKALDSLFTYLTKAMKTEAESKKYLFDKGYYSKIVYSAIEKAKGYGYIDDEKYIKLYCSFHSQTKGKRRLQMELMRKGIDDKLVKSIMEEETEPNDELLGAETIAKKFMRSKECSQKNTEKLIRHLVSRGYEWNVIGKVIKPYKSGNYADIEDID